MRCGAQRGRRIDGNRCRSSGDLDQLNDRVNAQHSAIDDPTSIVQDDTVDGRSSWIDADKPHRGSHDANEQPT